jgi:dephospho-CoA kinase
MLRVGLTGGLGSGKSTVAGFLRELGAEIAQADELGRQLMEPGQTVYGEIVQVFGPEVVRADGSLDRARLAELAFRGGRLNDLNAIVHPAAIAAQRQWMQEVFRRDPAAVAVVESALVFEVERDARMRGEQETVLADWRRRFDRVVVVTAPDEQKIARYAARGVRDQAGSDQPGRDQSGPDAAAAEARVRLRHQIPDAEKAARADYILENAGDRESLRAQAVLLWQRLKAESNKIPGNES